MAVLRALGEFRGILGADLGIQNVILGMQNSILRMASQNLSNTKTTILGAIPGAIPQIAGDLHQRFSSTPAFSKRLFENWDGPRAPDLALSETRWRLATLVLPPYHSFTITTSDSWCHHLCIKTRSTHFRCWLDGVERKLGRTDLTGHQPILPFQFSRSTSCATGNGRLLQDLNRILTRLHGILFLKPLHPSTADPI